MQHPFGAFRLDLAEHVGMAPDHLANYSLRHLVNVEGALRFGHLRQKDHLEQKVPQLVAKGRSVAAVQRLQGFIGFLQQQGLEGVEGLLPVPGATLETPQPIHQCDQLQKCLSFHGYGLHGNSFQGPLPETELKPDRSRVAGSDRKRQSRNPHLRPVSAPAVPGSKRLPPLRLARYMSRSAASMKSLLSIPGEYSAIPALKVTGPASA